ncbi:aldose epimerase family protein [Ruegeria conchae]|uniref:Aldose 1-epimerase n=1 Tax=Ruegeria conchae TaxID=981384 RepID=A0A497ZQE8_9RHOB|nr:aldose epimerase family protein [Ruegeria conchae]RLK07206.1 aldose 1-epimerase [Ruegeria conchae]
MKLETGKPYQIETAILTDGNMRVSVLNYGAITQGWWYKDVPLILGFDDPTAYLTDTRYLGAIVGRVANRISGAKFDLEGASFELNANEGKNTLHGGDDGLSKQFWDLKQIAQNEVFLSYVSRDGEGGFPGEISFEVRICLQGQRLVYSISAQPDRPTPISIAQHNYYTLGAAGGIDEHKLKLASNWYLEIDDQGVPSGRVLATNENGLDFSTANTIGSVSEGIDHYFCFDHDRDPKTLVAEITSLSGLALTVYSDQPGAQVYSGYEMTKPRRASHGVCFEPSGYPNAPNTSSFPSIIYTPENPYRQELNLEVSEE